MPKAEWGAKRTCPNCETRFYDLQRAPVLCPECGATFNVDDRGKVSGMRERRVPVAVAEDADPLVDDESLVDDEDEDDPLLAEDDDGEEEEPAGPALSDEEGEEGAVAFKDAPLIGDDEIEEDVAEEDQDDEDENDDLDDVPRKDTGA